jgi:Dual specificity phosphatase, catalytic domain
MGLTKSLLETLDPPKDIAPSYDYQPQDWPWVWAIRDPQMLDWRAGLSDEAILERQKLQENLPVHIYGKVYLGSAASVQDLAKLKKLGIRRVLNMAGSMALKKSTILAYQKEGIDYKRITALDEDYYPLLARDWKESHDFIHDPEQEGNVVVHCVAGMNRSGLVGDQPKDGFGIREARSLATRKRCSPERILPRAVGGIGPPIQLVGERTGNQGIHFRERRRPARGCLSSSHAKE